MMPLRLRNLMLVAIAAIALTACASKELSPEDEARAAFDDVRASIQTVVTDANRASQAIAVIDEIERNFKEAAAGVDARRAAIRKLFSSYDTPEADLEAAFAKMRENMRSNREKFSDTRRRLAEILTAEEWETLQKQRSEALEKAVAATFS